MEKSIHDVLRTLITACHLQELPSGVPSQQGQTFSVPETAGSGTCWVYTANPFLALILLDVHLRSPFALSIDCSDCTYLSYFHKLDAWEQSPRGEKLEVRTVYSGTSGTLGILFDETCGIILLVSQYYLPAYLYENFSIVAKPDAFRFNSGSSSLAAGIPLIFQQIQYFRQNSHPQMARAFYNSKIGELFSVFINDMPVAASFNTAENHKEHQIQEMITYLRSHLGDDIDTMADSVHMSKRKLTALFKAETGMTINEYRTRLRSMLAADKLGQPQYSITDIALSLGFSSLSSFSLFFKNQFGISPSEYREKILFSDLTDTGGTYA